MTHFQAYLLTRLDSFGSLFQGLMVLSVMACPILCFFTFTIGANVDPTAGVPKKIGKYLFFAILIALLFSILNAMIPTTKEAAFIYIAPALVNNEGVQKTLKKLPELSGLGLEYLGDILKQEIKENINKKKQQL